MTIAGLTALGVAAWYGWGDYDSSAVVLLVAGVVLIALNPVITGSVKVAAEVEQARLNERAEALATLVDLIHASFDDADKVDNDLRITLLVVDDQWEPSRLEPICRRDNSGRREPGDHGMTEQQGVAGESYRTRQTV